MSEKQRLDQLLHQRGFAESREKARAMIMAGEVSVDGKLIDKPGTRVHQDVELAIKDKPRYVSRGGDKLAGALTDFAIDAAGRVCADVGASTGGFTDCLLQHGAARVYAIDVGYGQIDYTLRQDNRVTLLERTNARYLTQLEEQVSLIVIDASFISLRLLLPTVKGWLLPEADIIALVKPQFEAGKREVGKGGVVRHSDVHARVLREIAGFAVELPLTVSGLTISPLKGPAGNTEFFIWLSQGAQAQPLADIEARITALTQHPTA